MEWAQGMPVSVARNHLWIVTPWGRMQRQLDFQDASSGTSVGTQEIRREAGGSEGLA